MSKPFDLKLFVLRLIKNIKWIIIGTLVGALLIGVPYVLVNVVFADGPDYEATVMGNETYTIGENGDEADYINEYTWSEYVHTDIFLDAMLTELGPEYEKETLSSSLSATVPADVRKVNITVTTKSPEDTMTIVKAVPAGLAAMKDYLHELSDLTITDMPEEAEAVYSDVRVANAFILGAVLGLFFTLIYMAYAFIMDDSVYIPLLFEQEYGIDMKIGEPGPGLTVITIDKNLPSMPELNENSAVALNIVAGRHNGKIIDYAINEVEKQGCVVARAYLQGADEKLIKAYFTGK